MNEWIEATKTNALEGRGHCQGCPAFEDGRSCRVNPGLFDPTGDVMFVTIEPSHHFDWAEYADWSAYNDAITTKFMDEWTGGPILEELLEPLEGRDMASVWMTDAIKCPPEGGIDDQVRNEEFEHFKAYLEEEIEHVDPDVIVGLGKNACLRTLEVLGISRDSVSPVTECGRIVDSDPPIVLSPHWSYGWLSRHPSKSWGEGWLDGQDHLTEDVQTNMDAVRESIRYIREQQSVQDNDSASDRGTREASGVVSVDADSHRGRICAVLSTMEWLDCRQIAGRTSYSPTGASSVLSDLYHADLVTRRPATRDEQVDYEYRLREHVQMD